MKKLLLLALCLLPLCSNIITLDTTVKSKEDFQIQYFYDETSQLNIEDLQQSRFRTINNQFALGYLEGNSWFKFTFLSDEDKEIILYFNEPFFQELNLYEKVDKRWSKRVNGLFYPLEKRELHDINPAFFINLTKDTKKTIYIQAQAKFAQFGEFKIYTKESYISKDKLLKTSLYMLYFGSLIIIVIFSGFLYYNLKEKIYLFYGTYIFFNTIFVFAFSGIGIYLGLAPYHYEFHLSIPILIIFLILFSTEFLNTRELLPITHKLLKLLILIFTLLTFLTIFQFNPWYQIITSFASITYILLMYVSISMWFKGHVEAKYYLIAMTIYTGSITIMSLMINGVLDNNDITRYAFLFGSYLEVVLFSLMLVHRFHKIQNEKIKIQDELIHTKIENETFLEKKIEQRTLEIQNINNELSTLLVEKNLLLKEVYHRVKNNFQIVISMLSIEANRIHDDSFKESLSSLVTRIKSMSLVHQFLYESSSLSQIDSKEYLCKIVTEIEKIYSKNEIIIESKIISCPLSMEEAMSLGIITNEILNNAVKHSHSQNIEISFFCKDNKAELNIKDNGIEFENISNKKGLGLKLVDNFAKRLKNSSVQFTFNKGCKFTLLFDVKVN